MKKNIVCIIVCSIVLSLLMSAAAFAKPVYAGEAAGGGLIDLKEHLFELSEDMDDDITVIQKDPFALIQTLATQRLDASLLS